MDIRNVFCLLMIFALSVQQGVCDDEDYEDGPAFGRCPWIRNKLKNGRVRYRYKGRVAKFLCDSGYELAGKRSSTCVRGQWSNPLPVCVARGCNRVPSIVNGRVTEMYRGALLVYDCNPGYTLAGDSSIHCDGRRWNGSSPSCTVSIPDPETHCDFETYDLCGWAHDPTNDFDWKRNQFSTPSGHVGTGPSFDHTFGENKAGYYLYLEASSPRKANDIARIFSPVFPAEDSGGCFIFWYHMYGTHTGGIRVFLKPETHVFGELSPKWQEFGDQGNQWLRGNISIPDLNENFQIVIEGIRGEGYMGDSAIDDVQLTKFDCESMKDATQITTEDTNADSCRGRCRSPDLSSTCGCNEHCHVSETCCNDYITLCFEVNETTVPNTEEPLPGDYYGKTSSPATEPAMPLETTEEKFRTSSISLPPLLVNQSSASTSSTIVPETSSILPVSINTTLSSLPTTIITSSTDASTTASTTTVFPTKSSTVQSTTETVITTPTVSTTKTDTSKVDKISTTTHKTTIKITTPIKTTIGTTDSLKSSTITTTIKTSAVTTTTKHTTSFNPNTTYLPVTSTTTEATTFTTTPLFTPTSTTSSTESSTLLNQTAVIINTETTTVSSSISTNTTSLSPISEIPTSSTPRYNLRPRKTTSTALTTDNHSESTTLNATSLSSTTVTTLKAEVSTVSPLLRSTPQTRRWLNFTVFPISTSGTTSSTTTAKTKTSTIIRNIPETSKFRFPKPTTFTLPSSSPITTDAFASKAESTKSGDSSAVVITVVVVIILCVIGGILYYFRKYRSKRQSKLDDDSEMRFLPENDYMEYSDASALDKILVK